MVASEATHAAANAVAKPVVKAAADPAKKRDKPPKVAPTVQELLTQRAVLTMGELCTILGLDRSTVLRKERDGLLPARRIVAGCNVFLAADINAWLNAAPASKGADPEHSRRSREIALARSAKAKGVSP